MSLDDYARSKSVPPPTSGFAQRQRRRRRAQRSRQWGEDEDAAEDDFNDVDLSDVDETPDEEAPSAFPSPESSIRMLNAARRHSARPAALRHGESFQRWQGSARAPCGALVPLNAAARSEHADMLARIGAGVLPQYIDDAMAECSVSGSDSGSYIEGSSSFGSGSGSEDERQSGSGSQSTPPSSAYGCSGEDTGSAASDRDEGGDRGQNEDESDGADGDLDVSIDSEARDVVPRLPGSRRLGPIDEYTPSTDASGAEGAEGASQRFARSAAQPRRGQRRRSRRRTHAGGDSHQRAPSRRRTVFDDVISGKRRSTSGRRFQSVVLNGTTELEGPELSGALSKQRSSSFMDDLLAPLQAWAAGGGDNSDDSISSEDDAARAARDAEHEAALEAAAAFAAERAHLLKEVEMTSFPQHGGTFMRDVRAHRRRMMCQRIALKGSSEGQGSGIFALHSKRCLLRDCIFERDGFDHDSGDAECFSFYEATLLIDRNAGTICEILLPSEMALLPDGCELEDVGDAVVMPGLVDPHAHLCSGRKRWEGFASGTQAAAAGGITTLMDMPTRCTPLTSSAELLEQKMAQASGNLWTDCGFYGGVGPENIDEVEGMLQAGAVGLVCYFTPPEPGTFAVPTDQETLAKLMELMADAQRTRHAPLLVSAGLYSEQQLDLASPMRLEAPDERLNKKVSVPRLSRASGRASSASGRSSVTLSHSDLFAEPQTPGSPTLSAAHSASSAALPTRRRRSARSSSVQASPLHRSIDSVGENLGIKVEGRQSYRRSTSGMDNLAFGEDASEPRQISDGTEDGGADGDEDEYWAMQSRDSRSPSPLVTPMGRRLHRSRRSAQRSNFNPRKKQAFAKNPLLNQLMKSELRRSDKRGHGHRLPGAADRRRVTLHEAGTRSQPLPGMGADRRRGHSLTETTMGKHGLAQVNAAVWGQGAPRTRRERGGVSNSPLTPGGLGAAAGDLRRSSSPPLSRASSVNSAGASPGILSRASPGHGSTPSKGSPVLLPMDSPKSTLEHMRARGARISAPPPISMPPPAKSALDSARPHVLRGSPPDAGRKKSRSRARDRFQQLLTAESGSAGSDRSNPQGEGVSEQLAASSTALVANRMTTGLGRVSRGLAISAAPASPGSPLRNELAGSSSSRPERRRRGSTRSESRARRSQEDEDKHLATLRLRRAGLLVNTSSASGSGGPATAAALTIDSAYKDSDKLTRVALRGNYSVYLDHHPEACEADGIEMLLGAMKQVGKRQPRRPGESDQQPGVANQGPCEWPDVKVHILQMSSALTIAALKRARRSGALLTVETCPHYLAINKDVIEDGDTRFKVLPPIRDESNCTALWRALLNGSIDMVVSAHTPCPSHLKIPGDFQRAMGGLGSIQFALPLMWTQAQRKGFTEECVAQWMCFNPAKMLGLVGSKGSLEIGKDADIVVWDPKQRFELNSKDLYMENKDTPFHRVPMMGVVLQTYVRGTRVFDARQGGIVESDMHTTLKRGPGKILRL